MSYVIYSWNLTQFNKKTKYGFYVLFRCHFETHTNLIKKQLHIKFYKLILKKKETGTNKLKIQEVHFIILKDMKRTQSI